ncbi:MAG TPA: phosphoadenosine phosphosulfate reductase family protein [Trichocoleus sp.]
MLLTTKPPVGFNLPGSAPLVPAAISRPLEDDAAIAISMSGGKDSQAMVEYVMNLRSQHGWKGEVFAIFADLGEMEWPGVHRHVEKICRAHDLRLVVVSKPGGMIAEWRKRYEVLKSEGNTKPFWSSGTARYCTRALKIQTINKYLQRYERVICCNGIRDQESDARALKPRYRVRNEIATQRIKFPGKLKGMPAHIQEEHAAAAYDRWLEKGKGRFALDWHPIAHLSIEEVWDLIGTSLEEVQYRSALYREGKIREAFEGFPAHWAYATGNQRLSCVMCVLGSQNDIKNGARFNPDPYKTLVGMEVESGWAFQHNRPLGSLISEVEAFAEMRSQTFDVLRELALV